MDDLVAWPPAGKYIAAVSGGVDSVVLLDLLASAQAQRDYKLVVAHFDHGMRPDSVADAKLVRAAAASYHLPFEATSAGLGPVSEAVARTARYTWLRQLQDRHGAAAIITAHHEDDLIETSLLNLARGSGRRGLMPFNRSDIIRPLTRLTKARLTDYVRSRRLAWHEDSTNADLTNPRNFLRHHLLPTAPPDWRASYLGSVRALAAHNKIIDDFIMPILSQNKRETGYCFPRDFVTDLSQAERCELVTAATRVLRPDIELDARLTRELAWFMVSGRPGKHRPIRAGLQMAITATHVSIENA